MFSCAHIATGTGGELVDDFDSRKELKAVACEQALRMFFLLLNCLGGGP